MQANITNEEYQVWATKNIQKMKDAETSNKWIDDGVIKADRPCRKFKMEIEGRLATKGVAENVEGTVKEFADMLKGDKFAYKLDPQMSEYKTLKQITEDLRVLYMRYKGVGPVQDRDFVLLEAAHFENDGKKFYLASSSCSYPEPEINKVSRAECVLGGYIAEAIDEKTIRVTYVSDADIKGSIPGFVKKMLSSGQGEIVSKVNGFLKEYRADKK